MTLLELTVVILVLLSLIGLLFAGSRAWKSGADRTACIMHQSNVQKALRGHANLYGSYIGDTITDLPNQLVVSLTTIKGIVAFCAIENIIACIPV